MGRDRPPTSNQRRKGNQHRSCRRFWESTVMLTSAPGQIPRTLEMEITRLWHGIVPWAHRQGANPIAEALHQLSPDSPSKRPTLALHVGNIQCIMPKKASDLVCLLEAFWRNEGRTAATESGKIGTAQVQRHSLKCLPAESLCMEPYVHPDRVLLSLMLMD